MRRTGGLSAVCGRLFFMRGRDGCPLFAGGSFLCGGVGREKSSEAAFLCVGEG